MATVYILYSPGLDKFYYGSCKDFELRMQQHKGKTYAGSFTAKTDDWELFWAADELEYQQARKIEAHIKKMKSKKYAHDLKKYPDILKRLKEKYPV